MCNIQLPSYAFCYPQKYLGAILEHMCTVKTHIYIYIFVYVCTVYAHMYRYALELLDLGQTEPGSAIVKVQSSQAHSTRSLCSLAGRASPKQL